MKINWKVLIICLVIAYGVAFIGSLFTAPGVSSDWYQQIKPGLTPPNYVFPIAWNILFFLIALSLYFAWIKAKKSEKSKVAWLFGINLILNIFWSFLFFFLKNPISSFIEIIILWFSILFIVILIYRISKISSYLIIPYLLWVGFASILNYLAI